MVFGIFPTKSVLVKDASKVNFLLILTLIFLEKYPFQKSQIWDNFKFFDPPPPPPKAILIPGLYPWYPTNHWNNVYYGLLMCASGSMLLPSVATPLLILTSLLPILHIVGGYFPILKEKDVWAKAWNW